MSVSRRRSRGASLVGLTRPEDEYAVCLARRTQPQAGLKGHIRSFGVSLPAMSSDATCFSGASGTSRRTDPRPVPGSGLLRSGAGGQSPLASTHLPIGVRTAKKRKQTGQRPGRVAATRMTLDMMPTLPRSLAACVPSRQRAPAPERTTAPSTLTFPTLLSQRASAVPRRRPGLSALCPASALVLTAEHQEVLGL